ncbi:MAG: hypothetical protein U0Q15_15225 [Kineosporiaceae bacterium]
MIEIGARTLRLPAPPRVVHADLAAPATDGPRAWWRPLDDERLPTVIDAVAPSSLAWTGMWLRRPDAAVRFELAAEDSGTRLAWRLLVEEPEPEAGLVGHLRLRVNRVLNADLRFSYGQ